MCDHDEVAYSAWLEGLEKDHQVALPGVRLPPFYHYKAPMIGKVVRTTKTQVIAVFTDGERRFNKKSGLEIGRQEGIRPVSDELLAELNEHRQRCRFLRLAENNAQALGRRQLQAMLDAYDRVQAEIEQENSGS